MSTGLRTQADPSLGSSPDFVPDLGVALGMLVTSFTLASASPLLIKISSQTCTVCRVSNTTVVQGLKGPQSRLDPCTFKERTDPVQEETNT